MEKLIYSNKLSCSSDIKDFIIEGEAVVSFENGCMRMKNALNSEYGQKANYVLWCPQEFPVDIKIEWKFKPVKEPGLCILFFAAKAINGSDIFSDGIKKRNGEYKLYHHGDINAFHISYFRRKEEKERVFHTCNLRKSYGFNLVAQGGDPIPDCGDVKDFYNMTVLKKHNLVEFFINNLKIFEFEDDGKTFGELLGGGKIGFRQLAPLVAEYSDFNVYQI